MSTLLSVEYEVFNQRREEFEREHDKEWVLINGTEVAGFFPQFQGAFSKAVELYGTEGPYLIEQIGVKKQPLPASMFQRPMYAL